MLQIALWAGLALAGTAVVWKGSGLLETASERLSAYYGLPDVVRGAVVVAVGSSFPELSTAVLSTLIHGAFELGVSAVVGSALFNILVIPGLAGLVGENQIRANRDLVYKEAQFYMIAVAVLTLTFSFAVIYAPVADRGAALQGEVTRVMALVPLALYALYIFVQWQDTMDHSPPAPPADIRPAREFAVLGVSLLLILGGVESLVRAAVNLGDILNTPGYLWGVTVVAAGTSVPDAFVSVRAARRGMGVTAVANVLGSNVFDLLVCIPAGVLIAGAARINFSVAAPMMGILTLATVALFLSMRMKFMIRRWEASGLLLLYGVFLGWIAAETLAAVDLVPSLPPEAAAGGHG